MLPSSNPGPSRVWPAALIALFVAVFGLGVFIGYHSIQRDVSVAELAQRVAVPPM